jgi:hypothetical protein
MITPRLPNHPRSVRTWLFVLAIVLVGISFTGQLVKYVAGYDYVHGLVNLVDVNGERNIPTVFAALLLAAGGALSISTAKRAGPRDRPFWLLLGGGFLFMTVDEALQLHEMLVRPMRHLLGGETLGVLYFAWVVPAMAVIATAAIVFPRFLLRLPRRTAAALVIAGAIYLAGAVGMELVGGRYFERRGKDLTYAVLNTIEETLEFAGVILFITALLEYRQERQ